MSQHRPTTTALHASVFDDAQEIIDREYGEDLTVTGVARRIATSRRQLQRVYAEVGSTTFRRHLTEVRMRRAAELLATTDVTVRVISRRVGYRQPAQFAKAFRRQFGCAPTAYRERRPPVAAPSLAA